MPDDEKPPGQAPSRPKNAPGEKERKKPKPWLHQPSTEETGKDN